MLVLAVCLLVYPLVFSDAFYRDIGVTFLLAAISASAWNIVGGYAGQVSVGHSMFYGFGAYTPLLVYQLFGWSPMAGIPRSVGPVRRFHSMLRSRLASLRLAAFRLASRP